MARVVPATLLKRTLVQVSRAPQGKFLSVQNCFFFVHEKYFSRHYCPQGTVGAYKCGTLTTCSPGKYGRGAAFAVQYLGAAVASVLLLLLVLCYSGYRLLPKCGLPCWRDLINSADGDALILGLLGVRPSSIPQAKERRDTFKPRIGKKWMALVCKSSSGSETLVNERTPMA